MEEEDSEVPVPEGVELRAENGDGKGFKAEEDGRKGLWFSHWKECGRCGYGFRSGGNLWSVLHVANGWGTVGEWDLRG